MRCDSLDERHKDSAAASFTAVERPGKLRRLFTMLMNGYAIALQTECTFASAFVCGMIR